MLPFEAPTIFEQLPRFLFKMPRVHQDQKSKYESDELFRRLSRESEVRVLLNLSSAQLLPATCHLQIHRLRYLTHDLLLFLSPADHPQIRYTGFRDRPLQERQLRFKNACAEGHTDLVSILFHSLISVRGRR